MVYALDLAVLPIGAIVIAVDCWGESPTPFRVVERGFHHIVGQTSGGQLTYIGAPLVTRMARPDEVATFQPAAPQPPPMTPQALVQMELF